MIIDLPMPPSVNQIWSSGRGRIFRSKRYKTWLRECDVLALMHAWRKQKVSGRYCVLITLNNKKRRGDCDNRIKAVLDWLRRAELTDDDRHCDEVIARWGDAPAGCRVLILESSNADRERTTAGRQDRGFE